LLAKLLPTFAHRRMSRRQRDGSLRPYSRISRPEPPCFLQSSSCPVWRRVKIFPPLIPASRKRRQKGNLVVSDETVIYGYESSATLTTGRLHYKLQIRPLVRECAPRRRAKQLFGKGKEKEKSAHGPQRGARHQDG
jgi:hypothetical protein